MSYSIDEQSTNSLWLLKNPDETIKLGEEIILKNPSMELLLLEGPLGAGKTTLVKGIAMGMNIKEPITSPTFPLSQHYYGKEKILIHIDLYRLENSASANELFLQEEEEAGKLNSIIIVEWPERLNMSLENAWKITISYEENNQRSARLVKF